MLIITQSSVFHKGQFLLILPCDSYFQLCFSKNYFYFYLNPRLPNDSTSLNIRDIYLYQCQIYQSWTIIVFPPLTLPAILKYKCICKTQGKIIFMVKQLNMTTIEFKF